MSVEVLNRHSEALFEFLWCPVCGHEVFSHIPFGSVFCKNCSVESAEGGEIGPPYGWSSVTPERILRSNFAREIREETTSGDQPSTSTVKSNRVTPSAIVIPTPSSDLTRQTGC